MQRHIFDGQNRIGRDVLDPADVMPWTPPAIGREGKLVYAEPRETSLSREAPESASPGSHSQAEPAPVSRNDDNAVLAGRQEGFARGLEEGRRQGREEGREEGHQEGSRRGYEEGLAAGRAEGLQHGRDEAARRLKTLDSLLTHLTHALNEQDYQLEQALFNLVREIAGQVVRRELSIDSSHIMQIVQQALQALPPTRDNVRILVNPDDQALVTQAAEQGEEKWRVIASRDILPGGCRVETDHSAVDFTVEQRFAQVIEQIFEERFAADDHRGVAGTGPAGDAPLVQAAVIPPGEQFQEAPEPVVKPGKPDPEPESGRTLAEEAEALLASTTQVSAGEPS